MTNTLLRAGALSCALLATTCLTAPAAAQSEPAYRNLDANGVDLTHGDYRITFTEASAGLGETGLDLVRAAGGLESFTTWDRLTFRRVSTISSVFYFVGNSFRADTFSSLGISLQSNGATLSGAGAQYTHQAANGTLTVFSNPVSPQSSGSNLCSNTMPSGSSCSLPPTSITDPSGRTITLEWGVHSASSTAHHLRLERASNSFGYSVEFSYANNSPSPGSAPSADWYVRTGATLRNGSTTVGTVSYAAVTGATEVTDMAGRVWRIGGNSNSISAIRRPGASVDSISVSQSGGTTTVVRDGVTTTYNRQVSGTTATMTVTDANSEDTVIVSDLTIGRPTSVTDPLNRTTSLQYDGVGRLTRVTQDEGNYVQYTLDARGNVTQTDFVPKPGSGLATITTSASFDSTCGNPVTCNRPNSTTDARNNTTSYTYDSTHGGALTVTGPAVGGVSPQTRYSYTLTNGEYRLTGISACASGTASTCVDTAAESRTVLAYDAAGNVTSIERRSGNTSGTGAVSATTAFTYTLLGDVETMDGPLSGTADTTRLRYNAARQLVGTIGPDPDGGGARAHRATRTTYTNALPTRIERGTVASQSDTDWAAFTSLEEVQQDYDGNARPTVRRLVSGSTTHALTQTSYDALGRPECVAQRMNPSEFSSLPSDACTLDTEGSFGPDRIVRTYRDEAGQVVQVRTGYGTSVEANEVSTTWTDNGRVETVTDAESNRTTYVYDGHDRLSRTRMPDPSTDNTSSTTDYEELAYDAAGNVVSRRLRDATTIYFGYDALGRLEQVNLPGGPSMTSGYDLLGRHTSTSYTGHTQSFVYDALGRVVQQGGPVAGDYQILYYGYDAAGRRTSMDYGQGLVVGYSYLLTGEVTELRENPSGSNTLLASFAYDDLGRRTSLTRGNGTSTSYAYDDVSRLDELELAFAGTSHDLTLGFSYNPASQIAANERSNDAFAFSGLANANVADTINGLNQVTATGGTSVSYGDGRGNITAIGSTSYGYRADNLMTSAGAATLTYDSLSRLFQVTSGGTTTQFGYDGFSLIAEYDPAAVPSIGGIAPALRRYVHGPGLDEPLVWYEGSGTSTRRWLHADERGSIVAVSDSSGNVTNVNAYDEYGRPEGGTVAGRFGYTGQPWLAEAGLYYYRARMYNPALGRFMQTDPIGYAGGMNLYAYVLNDPVNLTDPSGLDCVEFSVIVARYEYSDGGGGNIFQRTRLCWDAPGGGSGGYGGVGDGGGGGAGGGWGGAPSSGEPAPCPAGPMETFGDSLGFTVFVFDRGISVNAELGVAIPRSGGWRGSQGYLTVNGTGLFGAGLFGGAGENITVGYTDGPILSGYNVSQVLQGGAAWGRGAEASYTTRGSDSASLSLGPRGGAGAYFGGGERHSYTLAIPPVGC